MIAVPPPDPSCIDLAQFRTTLREAMAVFEEIDIALQERLVDFLITGHDLEVLLDLREALRRPNRTWFFHPNYYQLKPISFEASSRLLTLFQQTSTPAGYYHRLGQFCSQHPQIDLAFPNFEPRLPKWFNDLIRFSFTLFFGAGDDLPVNAPGCSLLPLVAELSSEEIDQLLRVRLDDVLRGKSCMGAVLDHYARLPKVLELHADRLMGIVRDEPKYHAVVLPVFYNNSLPQYLGELIDYGLKSPREFHCYFRILLKNNKSDARPILLDRLQHGPARQRGQAARWLGKLYGAKVATELRDALASESDREVKAVLERQLRPYQSLLAAAETSPKQISLPPIKVIADPTPLPDEFRKRFEDYLVQALVQAQQWHKLELTEHLRKKSAAQSQSTNPPPNPLTRAQLDGLYSYLEGRATDKPALPAWLFKAFHKVPAVNVWCDPRQLELMHVIRLLDAIGSLQERFSALTVYHFTLLNTHRLAQTNPYGLREMDVAVEHLYGRPHLMSRGYLMNADQYPLEEAAVWPAFVEQLKPLVDAMLGTGIDRLDREAAKRRQTAIAIASMMPTLPAELEEAAWQLVLSDGWTLRPLARPLVKRQADCLQRAIRGLADRRSGARMGAAELLQELGAPAASEAIEPLKKAFRKEKQQPVQGHLLNALETLGANIDEFLGRETLLKDATLGARISPRSMMWFPMKQLPVVRWAVDDQPLEPVILRWWLIQSVVFKSATCSPLMRRALELCRRDDTLRLARFILDLWIAFDTDEPERAELVKKYRARIMPMLEQLEAAGTDVKELEDRIEQQVDAELRSIQRGQSAWTERGMLAIVGAFGDTECVRKMENYIRNHHGLRARQAKAMLEVLPSFRDPYALRVLQTFAVSFRNATISKRARELLLEMSDQFGWTADELAERTIPDAGFAVPVNSDGPRLNRPELVLSYGRTQFRVLVTDQLETVIALDDGSYTAKLPKPQADDDKTLVRVAQAQWKSTQQILQQTKTELITRLMQAMQSRRTWVASSWRELLTSHVLAGIACRRLIWSVQHSPHAAPEYCRLLNDGSAVDVEGQPLAIEDSALMGVANPAEMDEATKKAWVKHLADNEVQWLFSDTEARLVDQP